jgi:hypothetical protein
LRQQKDEALARLEEAQLQSARLEETVRQREVVSLCFVCPSTVVFRLRLHPHAWSSTRIVDAQAHAGPARCCSRRAAMHRNRVGTPPHPHPRYLPLHFTRIMLTI